MTGPQQERGDTSTVSPEPPPYPYPPLPPRALSWADRPKVVVKADLLPAVSVLSLVALLGVGVGWLWSRLAPPQRVRVFPDGELISLRIESYHRFEALAVFVLLGLAAGVVTGFAVWMLRERRGPVIMIAAVGGSAVAAWLASQVGGSWAEGRWAVTGTPQLGDVIAKAPVLESSWGILAWPLAAAVVYGFASAWNGRPDLGRRLG